MSLAEILGRGGGRWLTAEGPAADVALSTRVRLARNLAGELFPTLMDEAAAERVLAAVAQALEGLAAEAGPVEFHRLRDLPPLERQALVERHLISPELARVADRAAVVLRGDEAVSVMVNEEDHLRIQVLVPGLQLEAAWELANRVDDALEQRLDYAFSQRYGYLTSCPTNTGTGMRASVMMHLPGLVMAGQAGQLFQALSKVGIAVRGLYGEGSEALANIFQVSNQVTLGQSEREILVNLQGVCRQLIDRERTARQRLLQSRRHRLEDRAWRAWGVLSSARVISTREAMALLSDLRLGIDLGIIPGVPPRVFNELVVRISPALLQLAEGRGLPPHQRDVRRADIIREHLRAAGAPGGDGAVK